jgi:UDP-glucose 4-epimerase
MKKALVTGGAGFIGSHLVDVLVSRGYTVTVLDDLSTGRKENLKNVFDRITFIEGSITDVSVVESVMKGADVVFHQAAVASVPKSIEDPEGTHAINVLGTQNIFKCAAHAGVRRVVYASSCAVYGNAPDVPKREDMPKAPASPYAEHKSKGEEMAATYRDTLSLAAVGLRYFNVFGPRQDPSSPYSGVISIFAKRLAEGKGVTIFGDGETTRDFVFVSDVVDANIRAAETENMNEWIFNVGTGIETSLNTVVQTFGKILDIVPTISYESERAGDIKRSVADISLIQHGLSWNRRISFEEGVRCLLV